MVNYTVNRSLTKPANSSYVGTWDVPVNANTDAIDGILGSQTTITPVSGTTTLSTAQFQTAFLTFTGALSGNCTIVFPQGQGGYFTVQNRATNSSLYTVTLQTTAASGEAIACPPYEAFDMITDGTNCRFRNFGRVGTYEDYIGSSLPNWVSACTIPPYLNCDGTTFSSATYPALATILGGNTLPDSRGRFRATLNQGQGRITSGTSTGGVDGNTLLASGGQQTIVLSSYHAPPIPITDPGHTHGSPSVNFVVNGSVGAAGGGGAYFGAGTAANTSSNTTGISAGNSSPRNFSVVPPTYIAGITMVRAA